MKILRGATSSTPRRPPADPAGAHASSRERGARTLLLGHFAFRRLQTRSATTSLPPGSVQAREEQQWSYSGRVGFAGVPNSTGLPGCGSLRVAAGDR